MEELGRNGGISLNLINWEPFGAGLNPSFSYVWSYVPYHFSRIIPNQPFPSPNPIVYPYIFPSTPMLGYHLLPRGPGAVVFPGDYQGHHLYFRPMVHQIHHITSAPLMIYGRYIPFFGEQLRYHMNFLGMIRSFWYPPHHYHYHYHYHHHLTAQYFRGYYGAYMSRFTANIPQMTIMEQQSLHPPRFDVDYIPYEAMLALQEQMGNVSTGIREEDISRNLRQSRYQMTEEECSSEQKDLCCICLADFCEGDAIGKINCIHMFHYGCIAEWLKCKNSCPSCRGEALSL